MCPDSNQPAARIDIGRALRRLSCAVFVLASVACGQPSSSRGSAPLFEASSTCTWEVVAPGPFRRVEAPSLAIDGELVVLGGFEPNLIASARVDAYEPQTDQWRRLADMPAAVTHSGFAFDGEHVWVVGVEIIRKTPEY